MKYFFITCVLFLMPSLVFTQEICGIDELWKQFKDRYNKTYTGYHDNKRRADWEENLKKIKQHNEEAARGLHSYTIRDNHLSDMSPQTYLKKMIKLTKSRHRKVDPETVGALHFKTVHLPEEINWVEMGFDTPSYNQWDCGSCYAFSIAGVLQGQLFKQTNKLLPLSAQQLVDCSTMSGNYGCAGGSLRNTLRYLDKAGGIMAYKDYPYIAKQKKCRFNRHLTILNVTSWAVLPARDERVLQLAVAKIGPIAASLNASPQTFQLYHSGIYDDPSCTSNAVNHAVLIVGYTRDFWILKNWWGSHWGENGYMKLRRHVNRCGISNYAAYAFI